MSRESVDGIEHIVIKSFTLPDDIVMNGGLYPAEEISKSFKTLERTLAPVEHPTDSQGSFISATDPVAIHDFHAGAYNGNVRQENGRVLVDKIINVREALKSDRGKRLLDRIGELETNDSARPIHTSVGLFLDIEELDSPKTSIKGQEYTWIARNLFFDHDAILLGSVGAATPKEGVGMAVNRDGLKMDVQNFNINGGVKLFHNKKTDTDQKDFSMKNSMLKALKNDGESVDKGISDTDLFKKYTDLCVSKNKDSVPEKESTLIEETLTAIDVSLNKSDTPIAELIAKAIQPVVAEIASLKSDLLNKEDDEHERLAVLVGENRYLKGLDAENAKKLPVEVLRSLLGNAENGEASYGIPLGDSVVITDKEQTYEMPK